MDPPANNIALPAEATAMSLLACERLPAVISCALIKLRAGCVGGCIGGGKGGLT